MEAGGAGVRAGRELIGAMPAVNAVLERLGFDAIVRAYLPPGPRRALDPAAVTGVLVRNLAAGRVPLYGLADWAAGFDPAQLGLAPGQAALLNDDRAGRALDLLYDADRASMMTALALAAVRGYGISADELHNDSTSLRLYGAWQARGGDAGPAPRPGFGHSKDHRPDLKQLVWILTASADGAVPVTARMADGNTADDTTHIATWTACLAITGDPGFLYVADCKLATGTNMKYIDGRGGRFVTVLPRSRSEDRAGRDAIAAGRMDFTLALSRPGGRKDDPPLTWETAAAPERSAEGWPLTWIRSSAKAARDARARDGRITRAVTGLRQLAARLDAPRCRLRTPAAIAAAADAVITAVTAGRWVSYTLASRDTVTRKQAGPGRPGPGTRYRDIITTTWTLTPVTDTALAARDAASDGCFPLITNDPALTGPQVLAAYKHQPRIERRFHTAKSVLHATPVRLHTPERIDALAFCLYTALLIHALAERQLRAAAAGLAPLPLYHENRPAPAPSGARILRALEPLATTTITHHGTTTRIPPQLTTLQQQIITLLGIPPASYQQQKQNPNPALSPTPSAECATKVPRNAKIPR
jgi:Domain of unknown function (DUF4277)/Transposase DDE domain